MNKVIITPDMVEVIAEIQQNQTFGEGFVEDIETLIDDYLLNCSCDTDSPEGLRRRVGLVRQLRHYKEILLRLFPLEKTDNDG